nr:putative disease resistance protein rga3 [Quercus suber]
MGIWTSNLKGKEPINSAEAETSPPSTSTSRSLLPVPSHPFTGTIVWLVNFITEFQNTYLSEKEDTEHFIYVDSERVKECLFKLLPGLITAHREIGSGASKNKRPFRECFPDNLYLLSNLRHLVISPVKLNLMPTFIGRLTSLQTLLQFTVLRKDGCQIGELRNLNNLRGELSIENLENVATLDEAKGARLHLKIGIHKLSLVWSVNEPNANFDIAQGLRPHCNLKVLKIFNCNSKFPSWVSNPSFTHLISITLTKCLSEELPPFGPLPLLESL